MKVVKCITIYCLLVLFVFAMAGCGKKADENKPISEVKAEAETMSVEKLRSMAMAYKETFDAKKADIKKLTGKLKDLGPAKMLGDEAKALQADIKELTNSLSALKDRFQVYYNKLKEKGGDLTGLTI